MESTTKGTILIKGIMERVLPARERKSGKVCPFVILVKKKSEKGIDHRYVIQAYFKEPNQQYGLLDFQDKDVEVEVWLNGVSYKKPDDTMVFINELKLVNIKEA